jgi:hypothetical protein
MEGAERVKLVHSLPGRTRFRCPWLRGRREEAALVADSLAGLEGMVQVSVRPSTGGVLCHYDPERLPLESLQAAIVEQAGVERPLRPDEPTGEKGAGVPGRSSLARAIVQAARDINTDLLRETDGRIDLGTLSAAGFFAAGAFEVATSGKLPIPPWFNLAWWALRTFTEFERDEG